ncbi:MAG: N-acetylgalactosamine-6-sulfatase [Verrucomicrobiales bacterium]|nr:N-acetylgalactosamine-6-sulfatase [Verrucomicrobiales bacterium]
MLFRQHAGPGFLPAPSPVMLRLPPLLPFFLYFLAFLPAAPAAPDSPEAPASATAARRPNIVVFLVDDMGVHDTSVPFTLDGQRQPVKRRFNTFYHTPNLEALAASGMRFTSAYAQSVCSPTRCGLLKGRNSIRHGITDWLGADTAGSPANWRRAGMTADEPTLPRLLQAGGWRTLHIGKAHFSTGAVTPEQLGFDVNIGGNHWGHPHKGYQGVPGYGGLPGLEAYDGSLFLTSALTNEAVRVLEKTVAEGRPFFLNMAFYAVHSPFTDDPAAMGDYHEAVNKQHRAFATMVEGMDAAVGQIRRKLVDLGVAENTLLVFLGDNGSDSPALSADGLPAEPFNDFPMRGKKGSKWEGGIRIPLIAAWAAGSPANPFQKALSIPANSIQQDIVASWDIPVTLRRIAGVPAVKGFGEDGHDLTPYLTGRPGPHRPQEIVIHYPHRHRSNFFSLIRQGNLKLIYNFESNTYQLYDLAADPTESHDLAASRPDTVAVMTRALARRLAAAQGAAGPLIPTMATKAPKGNVVSIPLNPAVDTDGDGLPDSTEDTDLNGIRSTGETEPDDPGNE